MNHRTIIRWTAFIVIASMVLVGFGPAAGAQAPDVAGPVQPMTARESPTSPDQGAMPAADAVPQGSAPQITASAVVVRNGDDVTLTLKNGLPGHKGYFVSKVETVEFLCGSTWQKHCEKQVDYRGNDLTIQARNTGSEMKLDALFNFYDLGVGGLLPAGVYVRFYSGDTPPDPPPSAQPEIASTGLHWFSGGFFLEGIEVQDRLMVCVYMKGQTGYVEFVMNGTPVYRVTIDNHGCEWLPMNLGDLHHTGSGVKTPKPVNGQYTLQITAYNPSGASKTETGSFIQVPFKAEWFKDMVWLQPVEYHKGENASYDLAVKLPLKGYNFGGPGFIRNNGSADSSAGLTFKGVLSFPVKCRENYEISARADVDASFVNVYVVKAEGHAHGDSNLSLNFRGCQLLGAQLKGGLYATGDADGSKEVKLMDLLIDFLLDPGWINDFLKWLGEKILDPTASVYGKLDLHPGFGAAATLSPVAPYLTSSASFRGILYLVSRLNVTCCLSTAELDFRLNGLGTANFNKDGLHEVENLLFMALLDYEVRVHGRILWVWMPSNAYTVGGSCRYPPYAQNESCRKKSAAEVAGLGAGQYALIPHPSGNAYAVFDGRALSASWAAPAVTALHPITGVLVSNVFTYTTNALAIDPATGQALLVWDYDDIGKSVGESMELRFSRWDGANWSAPAAVTEDALQDMAPQVAWTAGGQAVAVWQRRRQAATEADTVAADFMNDVEIASATYDISADAWSAPELLTTNQVADFAPSLARSPSGRLLAAWHQFDAVSGLETAAPGSVMAAFYDGGWGAPTAVVPDVAQLGEVAAGYGDGAATLAFTRLVTPTDTVTPTAQIWVTDWDGTTWSAPERVTDDLVDHKNLNVLYSAQNEPLLIWLAGDSLQLRNLASGVTVSYPLDEAFGIQDELAAVQDGQGNIAAVFRNQADRPDLYVAYYDGMHGVWGRPRPLTADEAMERSPSPAFDAAGRLQVAYGATASHDEEVPVQLETGETLTLTVPTAGQTDLGLLRYTFDRNLTVPADGLAVSEAAPVPGSIVTLSGAVVNTGDLPLENVTLTFYDGDPNTSGVFIGATPLPAVLPAGDRVTVTVPYLALGEGGIRTLYLVADAAEQLAETDEGDNRTTLAAFGPDLELMETWADPDVLGSSFVAAAVRNRGTTTTPPTAVQFHRDTITGTVLTTATVPAISPGEVYTAAVLWEHSMLPTGDVLLQARVNEDDFDELNRVNNEARLPVAVGPDLALSPYALEAGTLAAASVPVTLTLRNIGSVAAADVAVTFHNGWALDDTTRLITHTLAGLAGGEATELRLTLPGPLTCGLYIQVDNQIGRDVDWSNNLVSILGAPWCANRLYLPIVYRSAE